MNPDYPNRLPDEAESISATDNLEGGSTTFDVSMDAQEALRRYQEEQQAKKSPESAPLTADEVVLRVSIREANTPLLMTLYDELIIGRRDPATLEAPDLDLTPYGGYQMGISRQHAALRLKDNKLQIVDLGSRNGTYVEGKRLQPYQPSPIYDGVALRLGKIEMEIYIS